MTTHDQWFVYDEYRFTQNEFPRTMELVVTTTNQEEAQRVFSAGTNRTPKIIFSRSGGVVQPGWNRVIMADPHFQYTDLRRYLGLPTEKSNDNA